MSGGVEAMGVLACSSSRLTLTLTSGVFMPTSLKRGQGGVGVVVADLVTWQLGLFSWVRLCMLIVVKTGMGYSLCHLSWGGGLTSRGVEATGVLTCSSSCSTSTLTSGVFTPTSLKRG